MTKLGLLLENIPKLRVFAIRQIIFVSMFVSFQCACLVTITVDHDTPVTIDQREKSCHNRSDEGDDETWFIPRSILRFEDERPYKVAQTVSDVDAR